MIPTATISCPLCAWVYELPPIDPRISSDTLAGVFGPGIMAQVSINTRMQDTERALEAHLKTHSLVEWVSKVTGLQRENETMRAALIKAEAWVNVPMQASDATGLRCALKEAGGFESED